MTKWELVKPFSYWTPSTISTSVFPSADVSIITTPVLLTALNASAIIPPNSESLFVDIVAIWSIISSFTSTDIDFKYLTTLSVAEFIPSFNSLEFCLSEIL